MSNGTARAEMPASRLRFTRPRLLLLSSALLLFSLLAWKVESQSQPPQFDVTFRMTVHRHASPLLTVLMRDASLVGSRQILLPTVLLGMLLLAILRQNRAAILLGMAMLGEITLESSLKLAFHRPRPQPFFDVPLPHSYSFPSGHALVSVCFYVTAAWVLCGWLKPLWSRLLVWSIAVLLAAAIGFSRIYLGVHHPSDVLAGYAVGVAWVTFLTAVVRTQST